MRYRLLLIAALLTPATPALAQVTVDLRALDALPHIPPAAATHHPAARPAPRPPARSAQAAPKPPERHQSAPAVATAEPAPSAPAQTAAGAAPRPVASAPAATKPVPAATAQATSKPAAPVQSASKPAAPAGPAEASARPATAAPSAVTVTLPPTPPAGASLPTMAAAPPAVARLAPIAPSTPSPNAAPPPAPAIAAAAPTHATATGNGLRVTFGAKDSKISPASAAAIKHLAAAARGSPGATFNVVAYAAGNAADPSVARRLSLSRALAVRSVLMAEGIDSAHIYVRAMGSHSTNGPPNRVDITMLGANDPAAQPQ